MFSFSCVGSMSWSFIGPNSLTFRLSLLQENPLSRLVVRSYVPRFHKVTFIGLGPSYVFYSELKFYSFYPKGPACWKFHSGYFHIQLHLGTV